MKIVISLKSYLIIPLFFNESLLRSCINTLQKMCLIYYLNKFKVTLLTGYSKNENSYS